MQSGQIDKVYLTACPEPFAVRNVKEQLPFGMTVAEMVLRVVPRASLRMAHVWVNDDYIPHAMWVSVRPKPGTFVTIRVVPMGGGGGKNPLATVLGIVLSIAAPGLGTALATAVSGSIVWNSTVAIATGLVGIVGKLAISAIAPPPKPRAATSFSNKADKATQFISGTQNQALRFGAIPRVLGKMRMIPPYAANPFTETVGNDQYVRMLFCLGYGPLAISDLKIGETALSAFDGVEVEIRQGYDDDTPVTIFTNQPRQNDLSVTLTNAGGYEVRTTEDETDEISVDITFPRGLCQYNDQAKKIARTVQVSVQYAPTGTSDWSNAVDSYQSYAARVSPAMAKPDTQWMPGGNQAETQIIYRVYMNPANGELGIVQGARSRVSGSITPEEPIVPSGMLKIARIDRRTNDADDIPANRISDERDLSKVGDFYQAVGDFLPGTTATDNCISIAAGGLSFPGVKITGKQTTAIRKDVRFKVTRGKYDVRLKRMTADTASDKIFDEVQWTALRSIKNEPPVNLTGMALIALRIKATDQLNGTLGQFNCVVHSILPDWNGTTWIEQETSNPASLYREVLQGTANARGLADARIDLDALAAWHEDCADAEREFNYIVDSQQSVNDLLSDIAATGRASPAIIDGKWRVVQDKAQTVPVQHFTPRNSFGFQGEKTFPELPHAFRVRFVNRDNGWQQDERIVYDDGYTAANATKFEGLDLTGITSSEQAWRDGRYHIASARLRPETYSFSTDIEHIVCTRGDLVRLTHDIMLVGLGSARIKAITTDGGAPEYITGFTVDDTFTMEAGLSYAVQLRTTGGSFLTLAVNTVAGETKTLTLTTPYLLSSFDGAAGDLITFGESGQESLECIIKSIEPQSDLTARVTCVDAAPAVHTSDTGTIPTHASVITIPPDLKRPPAPVVATVQTGDEVLIRNADGSFTSTIVVTLAPYDYPLPLTISARIRATDETDYRTPKTVQDGNEVTILDVEAGEYYDIILVYKNANGITSEQTALSGVYVIGATGIPGDVDNFSVTIQGQQAALAWDSVTDIDLSHYRIKWSPDTVGATWASSIDLVPKVSAPMTSKTVPALTGTYLIKAVDFGLRESANEAVVVSTIASLEGFNAIATLTEEADFDGTFDGVAVVGGTLHLTGADSIDDWADIDDVANFDIGNDGLISVGTYTFFNDLDLGDVYTSRVTANISVLGINLLDNFDTVDNVDTIEDFDTSVDPSSYGVQLQLRTTDDDPAGAPTWSDWKNFVVGDYTARAFEFRILLYSNAAGVTTEVSVLEVQIDMPDRTESERNKTSLAGGSSVAFPSAFKATPAIAITGNDMATGDYFAVTSPTATGFNIRFFNAAGTGISRNFDYVAKGYGKT